MKTRFAWRKLTCIFMVLAGFFLGSWSQAEAETSVWSPTPLSAKWKKILLNTPEDELTKKACIRGRRVTQKCRDKLHYVHTNELYHNAYRKYLSNRGGAYVGVGSDQNLTFIAWAKSRFAFLMDYDPVVVWVNLINRALVLHSPNRQDFLDLWEGKNWKKAWKILRKEYKGHKDLKMILATHKQFGYRLRFHYLKRVKRWRKTWVPVDYSWLHHDEDYGYIRKMFLNKRIRVMKGDLLLNKSLRGIGTACRKAGIPVRVVYLSNAEQFWHYPGHFRKNFQNLYVDDQSILIRTIFTKAYGAPLDRSWIYIVHKLKHFQKQLADKKMYSVYKMMRFRKWVSPGLFAIDVPKRKPDFVPSKAKKAHEAWLKKRKQKWAKRSKSRKQKRAKRRERRRN